MPERPQKLPRLSERDLQANIVQQAKVLGWFVTFTWKSYHSPAGECDLRMVLPREQRCGRGLMVECKSEKGKLTEAQRAFLAAWATVEGCECYVVRPSSLEAFYRVLLGQDTAADRTALTP